MNTGHQKTSSSNASQRCTSKLISPVMYEARDFDGVVIVADTFFESCINERRMPITGVIGDGDSGSARGIKKALNLLKVGENCG